MSIVTPEWNYITLLFGKQKSITHYSATSAQFPVTPLLRYMDVTWITKIVLNCIPTTKRWVVVEQCLHLCIGTCYWQMDIKVANGCDVLTLLMNQYKFEIKHTKQNVVDSGVA